MNQLESLANELLLSLFEYLDDVQLIRAFYGLNLRFNHLLSSHFRTCHFDFRSIFKNDFDFICQHYLPSIADRVISLHLSDNDDTPQQPDLFLSIIPSLNQFIQLRSLSLLNIRYEYLANRIISQLPNLTHLTVSVCPLYYDLDNIFQLIDIIWNLPKLTHCKLGNVMNYTTLLSSPTVISISLQHLTINTNGCDSNQLARLLEYSPSLQYISIPIWDVHSAAESSLVFQSVNKLELFFQGSSHIMMNILKMMPNLHCLTIKTERIIFDGCQWEQIIEDHLPNLKILRFMMQSRFSNNVNQEEQIDEVLRSFQTQFWLSKHQWFVQCHWDSYGDDRIISLYTLPYSFGYFVLRDNMKFKSTCPTDRFDRVYSLMYDLSISKKISLSPTLTFSNLRNLQIELPFTDHFWSIVPTVNQLISLDIERCNNDKARCQLQSLLDRAPNLYSLTFKSSLFSQKLLFELKSTSIRRINLQDCDHWFNKPQCLALINSSFGPQCEVLFIKIKKRSNVLQLVKKMNQLRALIFQCQDDLWQTEENFLIEWLQQHLPSTCSITRDKNKTDIRIWIR